MACVVRTTLVLTLCVKKGNALTLLIQKADAVAHVVRMTFALTLCVCKTCAASGWQIPWHASTGRHLP